MEVRACAVETLTDSGIFTGALAILLRVEHSMYTGKVWVWYLEDPAVQKLWVLHKRLENKRRVGTRDLPEPPPRGLEGP